MAGEEAAAILVIGAYILLYLIIQEFRTDSPWFQHAKNFIYSFLIFMALAGLNLAIQLLTGSDAQISNAIQTTYYPYLWFAILLSGLIFILFVKDFLMTMVERLSKFKYTKKRGR